MNRVVVLGAAGMLGHKLVQELATVGFEVTGTIRGNPADSPGVKEIIAKSSRLESNIDAGDFASVAMTLSRLAPDVIVNCIGVVKQKPAAQDAIASISINALFPHLLLDWCARNGTRLIHFSTDCVFSGLKGSYREMDEPDPVDLYGRTKLLGEVTSPPGLTLRTSIIGRELSSFRSLVEWFISQDGGTVKGFQKVVYSGLTTIQVARTIAELIERRPDLSGLYHLAGPRITKFDLLQEIRAQMNLSVEIERETETVLDRSMIGDRFAEATGIRAPSWSEMIAELAKDPTDYGSLR